MSTENVISQSACRCQSITIIMTIKLVFILQIIYWGERSQCTAIATMQRLESNQFVEKCLLLAQWLAKNYTTMAKTTSCPSLWKVYTCIRSIGSTSNTSTWVSFLYTGIVILIVIDSQLKFALLVLDLGEGGNLTSFCINSSITLSQSYTNNYYSIKTNLYVKLRNSLYLKSISSTYNY